MHRSAGAGLRAAFDVLVAAAALATVVLSFMPAWFQATLTPPDDTGMVMLPRGAASAVYAHASQWAVVGFAAFQVVLLAARYFSGGRLRVPGDGILLAVGSALALVVVPWNVLNIPGPWLNILDKAFGVPSPWVGNPAVLDGTTLVMTRSYWVWVAVAVMFASLVAATASLAVGFARREEPPSPDAANRDFTRELLG